jgi:HD-GYP domain-containing protein (c-di-GMP phosphodiesterase class II)
MITERVYSSPRSAAEVLAEVRRNRDSQFCARCVDALDSLIAREGEAVIVPRDASGELASPGAAALAAVPA